VSAVEQIILCPYLRAFSFHFFEALTVEQGLADFAFGNLSELKGEDDLVVITHFTEKPFPLTTLRTQYNVRELRTEREEHTAQLVICLMYSPTIFSKKGSNLPTLASTRSRRE